jgi:histidinol-phosphate aminotransferase
MMPPHFRKNVVELEGYVPGEQPQEADVVKLNTNENPYPPSPRALAAIRRAATASLRLYPDPLAKRLRSLAAAVYGVTEENVIAGNGSDELLSILTRCFVGPDDRVIYPTPSYTLYDTLVRIQDGKTLTVPFPPDFALPESLQRENAVLTFVCNPNSPSGTLVPAAEIERLARAIAGILVVDEAYIDFAEGEGASALPLVRRRPNVVVLRSFSKSFSLAGLRIGLAFGPPEIIAGMMKVKDSYNLNRLSLAGAAAALEDLPWMTRNAARIRKSRKKLTRGLEKLGLKVHPSQANFVLARKPGERLRWLHDELSRRRIFARYFDLPGLEDSLRITVGAPAEVATLLKALAEIFGDRAPA